MGKFVVVGLGNFGASAALELHRLGHQVTAVDLDPDKVETASRSLRHVVTGDATQAEVLARLGIGEETVAIVSTGDDVVASALTAIGLRDRGVGTIHVKVVSNVHARILEKLGVTSTVFPERESARLLAHHAASDEVLSYFELAPGFSAQEMAVPEKWVGRSLRELELPRRFQLSVIAVHDYLSGRMLPVPDPDAPLKDSDTLLVAGSSEALNQAAAGS